jgi:hypothetical protein
LNGFQLDVGWSDSPLGQAAVVAGKKENIKTFILFFQKTRIFLQPKSILSENLNFNDFKLFFFLHFLMFVPYKVEIILLNLIVMKVYLVRTVMTVYFIRAVSDLQAFV